MKHLDYKNNKLLTYLGLLFMYGIKRMKTVKHVDSNNYDAILRKMKKIRN